MNSRAGPSGGGGMGMKLRNMFKPNVTKISPSRLRAMIVAIFILIIPLVCRGLKLQITRLSKQSCRAHVGSHSIHEHAGLPLMEGQFQQSSSPCRRRLALRFERGRTIWHDHYGRGRERHISWPILAKGAEPRTPEYRPS